MTEATVTSLGTSTFIVAAKLAGPVLVAGLLVGVLVSLLQAATQVQEMTLVFIPKILAVATAIVVFGPWMFAALTDFTIALFSNLALYAH